MKVEWMIHHDRVDYHDGNHRGHDCQSEHHDGLELEQVTRLIRICANSVRQVVVQCENFSLSRKHHHKFVASNDLKAWKR